MTPVLHLGSDDDFRSVREFLDACQFTEPGAAERVGLASLDLIGRYELIDHAKRERGLAIRDALGAAVKLFICGWIVEEQEVAAQIPPPVLASFEALGLVERRDNGWVCPVLLYPSHGLYLTSDRFMNPDGSEPQTDGDFIFLTLQRTGSDFMAHLPEARCDSFLDLGAGNGIAGLYAARNFAEQVWAVDITERAVHFAEFNRRLNGVVNMRVLRGDMYEPVEGLQFDLIAIHPPYSIASKNYVYAYGGEDGEYLARRAWQGAPAHLTPGGIFYCWTTATDRREEPLEMRIQASLQADAAEIDVASVVDELQDPETYAIAAISARQGHLRDLKQWRELFARLDVENMVYGAIFLRRHPHPGMKSVAVRRTRSAQTTKNAAPWLLTWESSSAQADRDERLLRSHPRAVSGAELQVRHQMRDGALIPVEYAFRALHPFDVTLRGAPWLAYLFSRSNGERSGEELCAEILPRLPEGTGREHVLGGLAALISAGVVEIEGFPLG